MFKIFLTAAKLPSLAKIIPPLLVGLAMGYQFNQSVDPIKILLVLLYGWFIQLYIVLMNDYADADSDRLHHKLFPQLIDRRVLTENLLPDKALLGAGLLFGILTVTVAAIFEIVYLRPYATVIALISIGFLWFYSFPPLKLNYRGGGELLEVGGVGVALPYSAFFFYSGSFNRFQFIVVTPLIFLSLAQAVGAGLKHRPADQVTGKKTVSVLLGENRAKAVMTGSMITAILLSLSLFALGILSWGILIGGAVLPAVFFLRLAIREHRSAGVADLMALKRYKSAFSRFFLVLNGGLIWDFLLL